MAVLIIIYYSVRLKDFGRAEQTFSYEIICRIIKLKKKKFSEEIEMSKQIKVVCDVINVRTASCHFFADNALFNSGAVSSVFVVSHLLIIPALQQELNPLAPKSTIHTHRYQN